MQKTIIVCGHGPGISNAVANKFGAKGFQVALVARSADKLDKARGALQRKNWLFAGSDDGGERAAAIYTLLGTAKLNDLNPESYLRYVLERIAAINQIENLLPWNLLAKMPELRIAA